MNISNGDCFSYKCELPKTFHIYLYVCDILLLTFLSWLGWYHWARLYVIIKIIHGFRVKVSYKKNNITRHLELFFLLLEFFVMEIKLVRRETLLQGFKTHYIILFTSHWNDFIIVRKDPSKLTHRCLSSVHLKEYFSYCKASLLADLSMWRI